MRRYKEESGFGYARITLYLLPQGDIFEDLRRYVDEEDNLLCDGASKDSSDDDFIKPALKPSLYPVPLKRQSFSSGRGKSTAAAPSTSSTSAFWSTALPAGARFPSVQLRNMQIDVLSL